MAHALSVASSALVGIILLVAPWTVLWEPNAALVPYAVLRSLLASPFTRGAVSGLGVVNLVLAVAEVRELLRRP